MWVTTFIFASLFSAVCGEQLSVASSVGRIAEEVRALKLQGKGRNSGMAAGYKQYVENLLGQMESADPPRLDAPSRDILDKVQTLFQNILDSLKGQKDADDVTAGLVLTDLDACNSISVDDDAHLWEQQSTADTTHKDCRGVQKSKFDADVLECGELDSYLESIHTTLVPHCAMIEVSEANIDLWGDKLRAANSTLAAMKTWFEGYDADCTTAANHLANQKIVCDNDQLTFEERFCEWRNFRVARCDNLISCYAMAEGHHQGRISSMIDRNNDRVNDAMMISYLQCLVTELLNAATKDFDDWVNACQATKNADYATGYNFTVPDVPHPPACETLDVFPDVSNKSGFSAVHYAAISADVRPEPYYASCDHASPSA